MEPTVIPGSSHKDERGTVTYNNDFIPNAIKRIYFIENISTEFLRGWQGHKIEQRWFVATRGSFRISLLKIDNWENPSTLIPIHRFELSAANMEVLHVPAGFISMIQSLQKGAKLMAMSDYALGEIQDEFRFPIELFKQEK